MATYEETKNALEGSIHKWEQILAGAGVDDGINNCPLCQLFDNCRGCPVDYTGHTGCSGEYSAWHYHQVSVHDSMMPHKIQCAVCEWHAINVINSLISLRQTVDKMFENCAQL